MKKCEKCGYCLDDIEGGTFIDGKKKVYFCSGKCLNNYEKGEKLKKG